MIRERKFFGRNGKAERAERAGRTGIGEPHRRLWDGWEQKSCLTKGSFFLYYILII